MIRVPATSANNGPGFDSTGLAVNRYLTLVVEPAKQWEFVHHSLYLPPSPVYHQHFIYKVAKQIADRYEQTLTPCKVIVKSDIPLARGLGSSASAVVAGIELANQLCDLALSDQTKLNLATDIESHPDNVAPALFGGLVISVQHANKDVDYLHIPNLDVDLVVYIPDVELKTEDARSVLPDSYKRSEATSASGIANLMIAALLQKDYELAGKMMEHDLFHEPYRANLIPNYQRIKQEAKNLGAYGTVISGAGPTMISFAPKGKGQRIADDMKIMLSTYEVACLQIDTAGLQVTHQVVKQ